MQEKIIIYLHADDLSHPSWVEMDAESNIKSNISRGDALHLAELTLDKEIIVIVPAEDVLLTKTSLPKLSRSRLYQALPFALEDQVIAEVDSLHFAPGQQQPDTDLPVAIVAKEKMQQWLSQLSSWNIQPDMLLSAIFALPYEEHVWRIVLSDVALVRSEIFTGFACDRVNLDELLTAALKSTTNLPELIHIQYQDQQEFLSLLSHSKVKQEMITTEALLAEFAEHAILFPAINLLQGSYAAKKKKFPSFKKIWRISFYLAATWIILLFLSPIISYFILAQQLHGLETQVAQIYKQHFPQANSIVAPRLRMEEKLKKITEKTGKNHFLLLTAYLAEGITRASGINLKRFNFQNNQMTVELNATSASDFYAFTDYLQQQGLSVKQQNANLVGERINATLVIS